MKQLKPIDLEILSSLIKNSKTSDRKLASKMGVSQPTVTRRRARMEKAELLEYTAIPNFEELGFEILAFSFVSYAPEIRMELASSLLEKIKATLSANPSMIFVSSGRGMGFDGVAVSVHKSYSDFSEFLRRMRQEWGAHVASIESFVVSLRSDNVLRQLTFKYLADHIQG